MTISNPPSASEPNSESSPGFSSLSGQFIAAMPGLIDPNFSGTLSLICEHDENGAFGLVINQPTSITLTDVFEQMEIDFSDELVNERVLCGGPVSNERGFVLHKNDGSEWQSSLKISDDISITTSEDIIAALAENRAPEGATLILGYAGWTEGQLEKEVLENSWLHLPISHQVLFNTNFEDRLNIATSSAGINFSRISSSAGRA